MILRIVEPPLPLFETRLSFRNRPIGILLASPSDRPLSALSLLRSLGLFSGLSLETLFTVAEFR